MYNQLEKIEGLDGRPYFPFLLGNGLDAVFIDYSGSMHCLGTHLHTEQHQGVICGWYKATHRDFKKALNPLLQSTYTLYANGNSYDVGGFDQKFDPRGAVLTTRAETTFCKFSVETFLTGEQVLVERYTFEPMESGSDCAIGFNLHLPFNFFRGLSLADQCECEFVVEPQAGSMGCAYSINDISGAAAAYIECDTELVETGVARFGVEQSSTAGKCLRTSLGPGAQVLTRYLILLDERDTPDYENEINRRIDKIRSTGYGSVLETHRREWARYQDQSKICIPDERLQYLYELGFYLIRSYHNPKLGTLSLGNYPALWGGGVSCADPCSPRSYLAGNRLREARRYLDGFMQALPLARGYARDFNSTGAYFPWFGNYEGKSLDWRSPLDSPHHERFNNALIPIYVWDAFRYTGDSDILNEYWALIQEPIDFLIDSTVDETEDSACIGVVEGMYEADAPFRNNLGHLLPLIKAIEVLIESIALTGRKRSPRYEQILRKLLVSLDKDYGGRMISYNEVTTLELLTVSLYLLPDLCFNAETLALMLDDKQESLGLATSRGPFRNAAWPEEEFKVALVYSHMKQGNDAWNHLAHGASFTTSLGIIPEKIRPDGYPINYYYLLSHSTLVMALQNMLAFGCKGLKILPAIPSHWTDLHFENLRVEPGVLVSLRLEGGRIKQLRLRNESSRLLRHNVEIDAKYLPEAAGTGWPGTVELPCGSDIDLIQDGSPAQME